MPAKRGIEVPGALLAVVLIAACASSGGGGSTPSVDLEAVEAAPSVGAEMAAETITAEEMYEHVAYLASDELAGRDTPSPGLEMAAAYLAESFASYGLEPAGDDGSFLQRYTYEKKSLDLDGLDLRAGKSGEEESLEYRSDFFVIAGESERSEAEVLFLGRIESILEGLPDGVAGKTVVVTTPPHVGMELVVAMVAARRAEVSSLVIVLAPELPEQVVGAIADQVESGPPMSMQAPTMGLLYTSAASAMAAAGHDLDELASMAEEGLDAPAPLEGLSLSLAAPLTREVSEPANVVALVRGSDPDLRNTYVVLSAHYDHVGIGTPGAEGDSIYNGADDDASGTALLLEVAQAVAALSRPPARSLVFLAVSGEEKGLLGSTHYAQKPTVPGVIVANINLDMISRNAPDSLIAIGQEYTSLGPLSHRIAEENPELGLLIASDPDPSERAFLRSDHVSFVKKEIPSILLTTWDHEDYHEPSDHVEKIDPDKAARVARFTFLLTHAVANNPVGPSWNAGSLEEVQRILENSPF
jgi:hypothetical protein